MATTGEGEASGGSVPKMDGGDDSVARRPQSAPPRKKRRRAKGCKTRDQRVMAQQASGGHV